MSSATILKYGRWGVWKMIGNVENQQRMENARHRKQTIVLSAIFILIIVLRISDMQEKLS